MTRPGGRPPPPPAPPTPPPAPAPPAPAPAQPLAAPLAPQCDPFHFWEVAYDRGTLGEDGIWRFPHHCRNCGLELLARDVADATAQADPRSS